MIAVTERVMTHRRIRLHAMPMTVMAVSEHSGNAAGVAFVFILLMGGTIFAFGYARAVSDRAGSDYRKTKEALPGMRKAFWQAWWRGIKIGFWVVLAFAVVVLVMVRGGDRDRPATSEPAPTVTRSSR